MNGRLFFDTKFDQITQYSMKSDVILRFFLTLTLALGISSVNLLSQEDTKTTEQTPQRNQGGAKGGAKGGQRGQAANRGVPDMSGMTQEQKAAALNAFRHDKMTALADACEVTDDQIEAFVKTQVVFENAMLKGLLQMQSAGHDRNKRQAIAQSITKANSSAGKAMKKILEKAQMKVYTKEMKARMPQRGQKGRKGGR